MSPTPRIPKIVGIFLVVLALGALALHQFRAWEKSFFGPEVLSWDEDVRLPDGRNLLVHRIQTNLGRALIGNPAGTLDYFSHEVSFTSPDNAALRFTWPGLDKTEIPAALYFDGGQPILVTYFHREHQEKPGDWYAEYRGEGGLKWTHISSTKVPGYRGEYNLTDLGDVRKRCASRMGKEVLRLSECTNPTRVQWGGALLGVFPKSVASK